MAFWKKLGAKLVDLGLPLLGTVLGGPAGGAAGEAVAQLLGVDNDEDKIIAKLEAHPQAIVKLKEYERDIALGKIDLERTAITDAGSTIRVEASSSDQYVRRTRPMITRGLFWLTAFEALAIILVVIFGDAEQISLARTVLLELFFYTAMLTGTGYTGYTLMRGSEKKQAMNPERTTLAAAILGALKK